MISIKQTETKSITPPQSNDNRQSGAHSEKFSSILSTQATTEHDSARHNIDKPAAQETHLVSLGTLSRKNSSVAHLLLSNPELKSKTWSIIHDLINQNKDFKQIPVGREITFNTNSGEISWKKQNTDTVSRTHTTVKPLQSTHINSENTSNKFLLGTLNTQSPTVSELLSQHPDFKSQRWNIIYSDSNKHKPFTKIPAGSKVYIENNSKEISWTAPEKNTLAADTTKIMSHKLDDAVKPFMGTPYDKIDCYTLVVHGLKNMGVNYRGEGSLSKQLLQMARTEGRADNAYFTGEGITQAIGDKIYSKSIIKTTDIQEQSQDIYKEMKALMQKGDILSFSLETKGHTGVISKNKDQWTFINSGHLDHSINQGAPKHGVGEETLVDEINNWIKLAQKRKESLQITVGRLNSQKLV